MVYTRGKDIMNVFMGIIDGFGSSVSGGFEECINNDEKVGLQIEDAIKLFDKKDAADTLKAIKEMA